jgi:hypothetical protein
MILIGFGVPNLLDKDSIVWGTFFQNSELLITIARKKRKFGIIFTDNPLTNGVNNSRELVFPEAYEFCIVRDQRIQSNLCETILHSWQSQF